MTDQELVRLAAKAQGVHLDEKLSPWFTYSDAGGFQWLSNDGHRVRASYNPIHNDGDALRLAVKLKLDVTSDREDDCCSVWSYGMPDVNVKYGGDPLAATRRAIVRAAAAIGAKL